MSAGASLFLANIFASRRQRPEVRRGGTGPTPWNWLLAFEVRSRSSRSSCLSAFRIATSAPSSGQRLWKMQRSGGEAPSALACICTSMSRPLLTSPSLILAVASRNVALHQRLFRQRGSRAREKEETDLESSSLSSRDLSAKSRAFFQFSSLRWHAAMFEYCASRRRRRRRPEGAREEEKRTVWAIVFFSSATFSFSPSQWRWASVDGELFSPHRQLGTFGCSAFEGAPRGPRRPWLHARRPPS